MLCRQQHQEPGIYPWKLNPTDAFTRSNIFASITWFQSIWRKWSYRRGIYTKYLLMFPNCFYITLFADVESILFIHITYYGTSNYIKKKFVNDIGLYPLICSLYHYSAEFDLGWYFRTCIYHSGLESLVLAVVLQLCWLSTILIVVVIPIA